MRNIEIKLRLPDGCELNGILLEKLGARDAGIEFQHDMFFCCPHGRLKLRIIPDRQAQLIHYQRADAAEVRPSEYRLVGVAEPEALLGVLDVAFGRLGEVHKRRHVYQLDNVRIHLDEVEGLGRFLEIEAMVDAAHGDAACRDAVQALLGKLGLQGIEAERSAYVDLLWTDP